MGKCVCDPVFPDVGPDSEDGISRLDERIEQPELGLEIGGVEEDVHVLLQDRTPVMSVHRSLAGLVTYSVEFESLCIRF